MKKHIVEFLLGTMLVWTCVGCGAESKVGEQVETATVTEEKTDGQVAEGIEVTEESTSPKENTEQNSEANTEPVEETTFEPETTETTEISALEPTEEPTLGSQKKYTYTDMTATMYAQQTVNVRDLPDTNGNKVGSLSTNDEIEISGQCNETSWYRFEHNGSVAYVSDKYVGENKVEFQQTSTDNSGQASTGGSLGTKRWYDGYEMNIWYDMGLYMYKFVPESEDLQYYVIAQEAQKVLAERYPERAAIMGGSNPTPVPEGTICVVVSSLQKSPSQFSGPEEGEIVWGEIPYIWK